MPARCHVLACATVMEEILPILPADVSYQILDFGLHVNPAHLRLTLQRAIDQAAAHADTIVLGYGLCSLAVIGLRANGCTLVIPRVDDCIAIFLGSTENYRKQWRSEPGTYYLTKGWIEVADTPFDEYYRLAEQFDPQKADWLVREMMKHYTRLVLIDTGRDGVERYRDTVESLARRWDLRFEVVAGCDTLVRKIVEGPWDDDFVVVPPGEIVRHDHFFPMAPHSPSP